MFGMMCEIEKERRHGVLTCFAEHIADETVLAESFIGSVVCGNDDRGSYYCFVFTHNVHCRLPEQ